MPVPLIHPELSRLASRIHDGEVVFFVGAGHSIDSEGLSAPRLIRRLLLRLFALDAVQTDPGVAIARFAGTFSTPAELDKFAGTDAIAWLAFRYYEVNEWMCRAYGELLTAAAQRPRAAFPAFSRKLSVHETQLAKKTNWSEEFDPIPKEHWDEAKATAGTPMALAQLGKLVFVRTLGFFDPAVMAGALCALSPAKTPPWHDLAEVEASFRGRLKPRHHVLARLAREGFCPTLLTTNFDLLLEGAFRLAGFCYAHESTLPVQTSIPNFEIIASPASFFTRGKAYRTATIVKLHGCARFLRRFREIKDQNEYLPQLVYTFREIQNWRDDSWAADYLRTLLRTRTFVFAAYSTADPVMHDTFRSVYEEMHRKYREERTDTCGRVVAAQAAPAYFLAFSAKEGASEFHGDEVLRAASRAVGAKPPPSTLEHPNYIRFSPRGASDAPRLNLDETLLWLHHLVFREQQQKALISDLSSVISQLDRPRPHAEQKSIADRFAALCARENECSGRSAIGRALAWSSGFHVALRREWACALALQQQAGAIRNLDGIRHPMWYFPASERPAWTAWSAVLELALHQLAIAAAGFWSRNSSSCAVPETRVPLLLASSAPNPTVLFRHHAEAHAPLMSLTLRLRGVERIGRRPAVPGHPARLVVWGFGERATPWRSGGGNADSLQPLRLPAEHWVSQPPAETIWHLALGRTPADDQIDRLLGSWTT